MLSVVNAIPVCIDNMPPSAPSSLSISGSPGNLLIAWDASIDSPDCSGILEYVIFRDGIELVRVGGDVLSFIDNASLGEGEYSYTVSAIDLVGKNAGASIKNQIIINRGGGSSGGSRTSSYECNVNWSCGEWSECIEGEQMRICIDVDECGTDYLKSETTRECETEEDDFRMSSAGITPEGEKKTGFSAITGAVTGAISTPKGIAALTFVLLVLASFMVVFIKKKKK